MGRRLATTLLLLSACKAELMNDPSDANTSQGSDGGGLFLDAAIDAPVVLGAWGTPALITGASDDTLTEDDVTLSSDKLELYFKRVDAADPQLYVMRRATPTAAFGTPEPVAILNSGMDEESPRLSSDNLTLYFGRSGDIYKSIRTSTTAPWQAPTAVSQLNTGDYEKWAHVCSTGYAIVSRAVANNGQNLFEGTITTTANTALTAFNTADNEQGTLLSADCLHLYFQSDRDGNFDIFEAERSSLGAAWSMPTKMNDFNTATFGEEDPWTSTDGRVFVYASNALGTKDLYISTR